MHKLFAHAEHHHSIVTRADASDLGVDDDELEWLVRDGQLVRKGRNTFCVAGSGADVEAGPVCRGACSRA